MLHHTEKAGGGGWEVVLRPPSPPPPLPQLAGEGHLIRSSLDPQLLSLSLLLPPFCQFTNLFPPMSFFCVFLQGYYFPLSFFFRLFKLVFGVTLKLLLWSSFYRSLIIPIFRSIFFFNLGLQWSHLT